MAAASGRSLVLVAWVLLLCLVCGRGDFAKFPRSNDVDKWATTLSEEFIKSLNVVTGHLVAEKAYNESLGSIQFETFDELELVKKMADTLSKMLSKKMDALWALVQAAEEAAKNYTYNSTLRQGHVTYIDSKNVNESAILSYNVDYGQSVNHNYSSVHIPVEIFDGDISILNGLKWTEALDAQFKKNYENDNQIKWQFFGSQTGFLRTYPASSWKMKPSEVDLFDVRRQSWYTQGSSSPKDMMILIDTSGSTHGQSLQLMKNAVKSILDTLGENDFVNIIEFSGEAKYVSDCLNASFFVQANFRNKKQLAKDVDALKALGQADYKAGLRFVFEQFQQFEQMQYNLTDKEHIGARCNKVIILLTDGGTDNAEDIFKQYNWPSKPIRVFTYAVGPIATPNAAIKWMACANRGYFSQIPAMGAIRARVQDYLEVLGRPLALNYVEHTLWSSSHYSPFTQVNSSGQGMMTTVTLPVYNRTLGSSNQTILGVMGIDVPTTELGKETPFEIGPTGYSFAINPNGYAVYHPNLRRTARYMKDPPNIDLMELELVQDQERESLSVLRNGMVEGQTAYVTIDNALFLSPDQKYVSPMSARYVFTNITNTTFRLGLCLPKDRPKYPKFNIKSLPDISSHPSILIAPWDYLGSLLQGTGGDSPPMLDGTLNSLTQALANITKAQYDSLSDSRKQRLHQLALDRKIADKLMDFFKLLHEQTIKQLHGIKMTGLFSYFMAANSGLSFFFQQQNSDIDVDTVSVNRSLVNMSVYDIDLENSDIDVDTVSVNMSLVNMSLTAINLVEAKGQDITNLTFYTRAMYSADLMFDTVTDPGSRTTAISVSRSVAYKNHRFAVTGATFNSSHLRDYMLMILRNASSNLVDYITINSTDEIVCYIINDGGFLIFSNHRDENDSYVEPSGKFLGEIDPQVWNVLYNKNHSDSQGMFGRSIQYDFQAKCPKAKMVVSSGYRSLPSLNGLFEILTTGWWTSKFTWAFASFNIYNWLFDDLAMGTYAAADEITEEEDCVLATQQFYLRVADSNFTGSVPCNDGSERSVITRRINQTNLLLVIAKEKFGCKTSDLDYIVYQKPYRLTAEEERSLVCSLSQIPYKRVRSYGCYDRHDKEDDSKCTASSFPCSRLVTLLATAFSVLTVQLLGGSQKR